MKRKGPQYLQCSYDIIRIDSLMNYIDIIEYIILGDPKFPSLCCILFISGEKNEDIISST